MGRHETVNTRSEQCSPRVEDSIPVMACSHCDRNGIFSVFSVVTVDVRNGFKT